MDKSKKYIVSIYIVFKSIYKVLLRFKKLICKQIHF